MVCAWIMTVPLPLQIPHKRINIDIYINTYIYHGQCVDFYVVPSFLPRYCPKLARFYFLVHGCRVDGATGLTSWQIKPTRFRNRSRNNLSPVEKPTFVRFSPYKRRKAGWGPHFTKPFWPYTFSIYINVGRVLVSI